MYVKNISDGYFHLKNTFWVMKLHMVFIHLVFVTVLKGFKVPLTEYHLSSINLSVALRSYTQEQAFTWSLYEARCPLHLLPFHSPMVSL